MNLCFLKFLKNFYLLYNNNFIKRFFLSKHFILYFILNYNVSKLIYLLKKKFSYFSVTRNFFKRIIRDIFFYFRSSFFGYKIFLYQYTCYDKNKKFLFNKYKFNYIFYEILLLFNKLKFYFK